jgi:hypothetical protein
MPWRHMEQWTYNKPFLISALDGGGLSASCPGCFTSRERAPGSHRIRGGLAPKLWSTKKIASSGYLIPAVHPTVRRYIDWAIQAPLHVYNVLNMHAEWARTEIPKSSIFWHITPCILLQGNRRFCSPSAFTLVSSTLKMEETCSSETSVDFQRTTWYYIPEDIILHNHLCENLKF